MQNCIKTLLALVFSACAFPQSSITVTCQSYKLLPPNGAGQQQFACAAPWMIAPAAATAPSDPLDPSYAPPQDQNPADYPGNVWLTSSLAKVRQEDPVPSGAVKWLTVHAAQNEIASFQVHVHGAGPLAALRVSVSDLTNAQTGTKIASTDIIVFAERYQNVTIPTGQTSATFYGITGHYPDILIPAVDPYYGQTSNAFPIAVPANTNQSVWIDVHVPASAASGYYAGYVTVSDGATILAKAPITYAVWDWAMPSTSSLPSVTSVGYGGFCKVAYPGAGCGAYPGAGGQNDYGNTLVNADATLQMLDNRFSLPSFNIYPGANPFSLPPPSVSFTSVYGPLLSGTHPKSILKGARLTSAAIALLSPSQNTQAAFSNWASTFAANNWAPLYWWTTDEPGLNPSSWAYVVSSAGQDHAFNSGCKPPCTIPAATTAPFLWAQQNNALNAVDRLIVNLPTYETTAGFPYGAPSDYKTWIAGSSSIPRSTWSYLSCDSAGCTGGVTATPATAFGGAITYPNYDVDGTPMSNRMHQWLIFAHGQTGELYYIIDECESAGVPVCGDGAPGATATYDATQNNYYSGGWGDGTLMYTCSTAYAGVATPIWCPSMRLKMIRDGMQDYEYLKAVPAALAQSTIASIITNSFTFTTDTAAFQSARDALGLALHRVKHPAGS